MPKPNLSKVHSFREPAIEASLINSGSGVVARLLVVAGMAVFVVLSNSVFPQPLPAVSGMVKNTNATSASAQSVLQTTIQGLHCWRNSTVPHGKRHFLVTGCGYSSTGFIKAAFTAAGYKVGHEVPGHDGVSAWQAATGNFYSWAPPFSFRHVFLVVRHPLKVIRSREGTGWDSEIGRVEEYVSIQPRTEFDQMKMEFKTLDWWYSYTSMGENLAECSYRAEDMNAHLLQEICFRSELPGCETQQWEDIIQSNASYNSHTKKLNANWTVSWEQLENTAETTNEKAVLERARLLCRKYYKDC
jgi:hypothetical protein